jgi:hypothetical protein
MLRELPWNLPGIYAGLVIDDTLPVSDSVIAPSGASLVGRGTSCQDSAAQTMTQGQPSNLSYRR